MVDQSTTPVAGEPEANFNATSESPKRRGRPPGKRTATSKAQPKKAVSAVRTYSEQERADMMSEIAAKVKERNCTFKEAIKDAGISEQTYYQWKKAKSPEAPVAVEEAPNSKRNATGVTAGGGVSSAPLKILAPSIQGDGPDIVQLQRENLRLRQIFADKLMAANDELRKRIATL